MTVDFSRRRRAVRFASRLAMVAGVIGMVGALSSCSLFHKKKVEEMDCPAVRLDKDTASLTEFRPGGGTDLTDVTFTGQIVAFNGDCGWDPKTRTVDVKMKVLFSLTRGPALQGLKGSLQYFIAVPAYYPKPAAKQILPVTFQFPEGNVQTIRVRDAAVEITLPLGKKATSKDTPIYVGFQLTPEQLAYNRKMKK